jgi:hypothetical protein
LKQLISRGEEVACFRDAAAETKSRRGAPRPRKSFFELSISWGSFDA